MKNNKGFSLVELIIVIAIMAILVGVMAPQLIKYVEKTNAANDVQVCDSVRSAIQTAMLDPTVVMEVDYTTPTSGTLSECGASGGEVFEQTVKDILGVDDLGDMVGQLKSTYEGTRLNTVADCIEVQIVNENTVIVYIADSDSTGEKGDDGINSIYSGVLRPSASTGCDWTTADDGKAQAADN